MIETLPQTRRQLLRASACGGLSLSGLWRAQSALAEINKAATAPKIKACIVVFYYGGPSHLDTYDLKPNANLLSATCRFCPSCWQEFALP